MTSSRSAPAPGPNSTALDQWRGVALLCVLISHGLLFTGRVEGIGRIGVNLFFFISGLLVFRSLAGSRRAGFALTVSFWRKRLRRLYPALLGYVAAMGVAVWWLRGTGSPSADPGTYLRSVPFALTFTTNFYGFNNWTLGHLWSVSVEMQFYLLAPAIFLLARPHPRAQSIIWLLLLLVLMAIAIGTVVHGYKQKWEMYEFQVAVWPMMLGFVCEARKAWLQGLPRGVATAGMVTGSALVLLACALAAAEMRKTLVVPLGAVVFIPCLLCYVQRRALGGRPGAMLAWCGERTYSIYLWQQPLTICGFLPAGLEPFGALAAIPVGAIWYAWLEKPFLSSARQKVVAETLA